MKPKVGVLTTFYSLDSSYSLCGVVTNQLISLVKHGYSPVLFVLPSFKDADKVPEGVELRKVVPQLILEPYHQHIFDKGTNAPASFQSDVDKVVDELGKSMKDIDIAITHDWMLVDDYMPYAYAIQKLELPIKWLHWIHSAVSGKPSDVEEPWISQYRCPPKTKIVTLNNFDVVRVAERYGTFPENVRVIHNPTDLRTFFGLNKLVQGMIDEFKLFDADIVQVYPVSTPRMVDNKQVHKVIKIFGKLKAQGKNVRLIVCNAHANAEAEKTMIDNMKQLALDNGLDIKTEVIFTSKINPPEFEAGVTHDVVKDLFLLSNLFIFPTTSENCPLILLEAASARNLLVLNDDLGLLHEFFGEQALYFKFSSARQNTTYENEDNYYDDVAKIIISELKNNKPLNAFTKLKQAYNYDVIFKEMESLFYEGMEAKP